jgi:hypothetical protein
MPIEKGKPKDKSKKLLSDLLEKIFLPELIIKIL